MTQSSATLLNSFDIQIDSNHTWGEPVRTVDISVYELIIDEFGNTSTDTLTPLAHVEIHNAEAKCEDTWLSSEDTGDIAKLPERWQVAVRQAVELAAAIQTKPSEPFRYEVGDTVFLTEHRFPADVEYYTTEGYYVVNMANSGERGTFTEAEIEPYDFDRWND
jgi:hypothetical protein